MSDGPLNAAIAARRDASPHVTVLHVRPDAGSVHPFVPGQFVQLGWPKERKPDDPPERVRLVKRSYSIASAPNESGAYEICLALVANGLLTPTLWALREGDRVWCDDAPKGFFTLERVPRDKNLVFMATGTGIAPFVSMLRQHASDPPWKRALVVCGARVRADLAYDEEIRGLAARDERVRYAPVLSREGAEWQGLRGHVQTVLEPDDFAGLAGFELDPSDTHVLLCGNPDMIIDARTRLETRGFVVDTAKQPGTIHFERYW